MHTLPQGEVGHGSKYFSRGDKTRILSIFNTRQNEIKSIRGIQVKCYRNLKSEEVTSCKHACGIKEIKTDSLKDSRLRQPRWEGGEGVTQMIQGTRRNLSRLEPEFPRCSSCVIMKWYSLLRTLLHNWSIGFLWPLVAQLRVFILPPIFVSQNHKNIAPPFLPSCYSTQGSPCHMKSASPFQPPLADSFWFSFLRFFSLWSIFKSSLNLLQYCFSVLCLGVFLACGILAPWPGIELTSCPLHWKTKSSPWCHQGNPRQRVLIDSLTTNFSPLLTFFPELQRLESYQVHFSDSLLLRFHTFPGSTLKTWKQQWPPWGVSETLRDQVFWWAWWLGTLAVFEEPSKGCRASSSCPLCHVTAAAVVPALTSCGRPSRSQLPILQIWFSGCAEDLVLFLFFFF